MADESPDTATFFESFQAAYPVLELKKFASVSTPIEADLYGFKDLDDEDDEDEED
ncbi:MAG: hypothetical protein AAFX93_06720 [Verrucomicrobiota bacterium]